MSMRTKSLATALALGCAVALDSGCNGDVDREGTQPLHVFIIVLENKNFAETFDSDSKAPYLAQELTARGQLLRQYYGIGHLSLDNYVAMVSGQGPNTITQGDCVVFLDFVACPCSTSMDKPSDRAACIPRT
jgi:hypothetical protein